MKVAATLGALALLAAAPPALAAPPGQTIVFEEHAVNEPVSEVAFFPCLGEPGMEDDAAQITGRETRHIVVTAAGVDETGAPIPPLTVRATVHRHATIDPLAAGLPAYSGSSMTIFREQVSDLRSTLHIVGLFKATATDGSDRLTFRFLEQVVVAPDGTVRVERTVAECAGELDG